MTTRGPISIHELNRLDRAAFVEVVSPAFEHSPWIAERTWPLRPFAGRQALYEALCRTIHTAEQDEQVQLIQAHPDLVGRAARAGTLTAESAGEQAAAGLDTLSKEEVDRFDAYNRAYRERFGFPFVICARKNKTESILAALPVRLDHTRDEEIAAALHEIEKIASLRLQDIVSDE